MSFSKDIDGVDLERLCEHEDVEVRVLARATVKSIAKQEEAIYEIERALTDPLCEDAVIVAVVKRYLPVLKQTVEEKK